MSKCEFIYKRTHNNKKCGDTCGTEKFGGQDYCLSHYYQLRRMISTNGHVLPLSKKCLKEAIKDNNFVVNKTAINNEQLKSIIVVRNIIFEPNDKNDDPETKTIVINEDKN